MLFILYPLTTICKRSDEKILEQLLRSTCLSKQRNTTCIEILVFLNNKCNKIQIEDSTGITSMRKSSNELRKFKSMKNKSELSFFEKLIQHRALELTLQKTDEN
jgi:hypothetical protein